MAACHSFNSTIFADLVATACLSHYTDLPKTGKPQKDKEWTHMAAVVKSESNKNEDLSLEVVSMATGSKCLGPSSLSADGYVIHDSHAEVLTRRAFLRYLYHQVRVVFASESSSILDYCTKTTHFRLKKEINFHLFVSHTPCGDASIFPKKIQNQNSESDDGTPVKKPKLDDNDYIDDIYRTGAKCVPSGPQDEKLPGSAYHITKVVRTKPGRGDRTASVSCSDKIAKWNVVGLQGALLSHFLVDPIYLSTIVIARCPYDESALRRAVITRHENVTGLPENYRLNYPYLLQSTFKFPDGNDSISKIPSGAAIIWSRVPNHQSEVSVKGLRQGATKRQSSLKSSCAVSKRNLLVEFMSVVKETSVTQSGNNLTHLIDQTYRDCKLLSKPYQQANGRIRDALPTWPNKVIKFEMFEI